VTKSLHHFNSALGEARELFECYEALNNHPEIPLPSGLKKATLILILTAWETYVEDVATELFEQKFTVLKGCHLGNFAQKQFNERLKLFHNPNSRKTKHLFEEFFDIDVTENWQWNNVFAKDAREQLNHWISKRGQAVHRSNVGLNQPQVVNKKELEKCLRFFSELACATDKALENV
jgi:hypothetical protein